MDVFQAAQQLMSPYLSWYGLDVLVKLLVSAALSGMVGFERRIKGVGPRTYMLIGMGTTLLTVISISPQFALLGPGYDPSRIISQILVGVGFIGAGVIWKESGSVHGLTTAASIWATTAMAIAIGLGMWEISLYMALIIVMILVTKKWIKWT